MVGIVTQPVFIALLIQYSFILRGLSWWFASLFV